MLIKYEFLKILRKKSTIIIMAASFILTTLLFGIQIIQYQVYNENGVIKGPAGIAYEKEQYKDLSVSLSEEYITKTILEVQQLFKNPDNIGYDGNEQFLIGDAYWNSIAPREKLLNTISKAYDSPDGTLGYNKFRNLDIKNGANFYQAVKLKIKTLLDDPSGNLSVCQKEYWSSMAEKAGTPFQYGYYGSWEIIISSFELLIFAILAVCIVIAPVFSGAYQAGTESIILSGKYGKTKLVTAKIISSFLFGIIAFTLHVVLAYGIIFTAFGTDGWALPVQIANITIPYPFTFLQAALINIGVIYLILFAMVSFTLLLSSKMKTTYLVLAVLVPVLFIPVFLTPNGTTGVYNLVLFLLPYRAVMPEIGKYISYQFGNFVFNIFSVRAVLYVALTLIMIPFAKLGFKKHQAV